MRKSRLLAAGLAVTIICAIGLSASVARQRGPDCPGGGWWADLSDEQREEVHAKIEEMREEGASRQQICPVVAEMLTGYGIEISDDFCQRGRGFGGHFRRHEALLDMLTEEQRAAVRERARELREAHATRKEVREAVREMIQEYGVEMPEHPGPLHGARWLMELTEEQREAIRETAKELKESGATREEIHGAVGKMIEDYGVELPENWQERQKPGPVPGMGRRAFLDHLTDEQRVLVQEKIEELRDQGAEREQIHATITEMLEGWGVELPEEWHEGCPTCHFMGLRHRHLREHLTEEQMQLVEEKAERLRDEGATREHIHEEIVEMIRDWGVKLPERPRLDDARIRPFADLTEEQRRDLRNSLRELCRDGATREDIRQEIRLKLEEYGIELPRHPRAGSGETLSDVEAEIAPKSVLQSYADPNPFERETTIFYTLVTQDDVRIQVFNAVGQLVRDLGEHPRDPGTYSVQWDATDGNGVPVPGGVYLYRIEVDGEATTGRLVFLR